MAKKLNIGEMLGAAVSNSDTMQVRDIPIQLIDGNKDNSYAMTAIDELAESIEIAGLQQPLVVRPVGDRYLLLAGHRRKAALAQLGRTIAPCFVQDMELDPSMETLILHWTNTMARGALDGPEAAAAAKEITSALTDLRDRGVIELKGKMRTHVAEFMQKSEAALARLKSIEDKLLPGWHDLYKRRSINESLAYELSQLDRFYQCELWDDYCESNKLPTPKDVNSIRKKPPYKDEDINQFIIDYVIRGYADNLYILLFENTAPASSMVSEFKQAIRFYGYSGGTCKIGSVPGDYCLNGGSGLSFRPNESSHSSFTLRWPDVVSRVRDIVMDGQVQHSDVTSTPEAQAIKKLSDSVNQEPMPETGDVTKILPAVWYENSTLPPDGVRIIILDDSGWADEGVYCNAHIDGGVIDWDDAVLWTLHPSDPTYGRQTEVHDA